MNSNAGVWKEPHNTIAKSALEANQHSSDPILPFSALSEESLLVFLCLFFYLQPNRVIEKTSLVFEK